MQTHPPAAARPRGFALGRDASGFTLIELVVVMAISTVVLFAIGTMLVVLSDQANHTTARIAATDDAGLAMALLTREYRQAAIPPTGDAFAASNGTSSTASSLVFYENERPGGVGAPHLHQLTWSCGADPGSLTVFSCSQYDKDCVTSGACGSTMLTGGYSLPEIDGLTTANVFSASPTVSFGSIPSLFVSFAVAVPGTTVPVQLSQVVTPEFGSCQMGTTGATGVSGTTGASGC